MHKLRQLRAGTPIALYPRRSYCSPAAEFEDHVSTSRVTVPEWVMASEVRIRVRVLASLRGEPPLTLTAQAASRIRRPLA